MLGSKFTRLVEKHSDELSKQLAHKLHTSTRTKGFHNVPLAELEHDINVLYRNLGDWLLHRTESDIQAFYKEIGKRRAAQKIPSEEMMWAFTMAKEHIIDFLRREAGADNALALFAEIEFILTLTQFFDRAIYFAVSAQRLAATLHGAVA